MRVCMCMVCVRVCVHMLCVRVNSIAGAHRLSCTLPINLCSGESCVLLHDCYNETFECIYASISSCFCMFVEVLLTLSILCMLLF